MVQRKKNLQEILAESSSQRKKKKTAAGKRPMLPAKRNKSQRIQNRTLKPCRPSSPIVVSSPSPSAQPSPQPSPQPSAQPCSQPSDAQLNRPQPSAQPCPPRDLPATDVEDDNNNQPHCDVDVPSERRVRTFCGPSLPACLVKKPRNKLPRRAPLPNPPVPSPNPQSNSQLSPVSVTRPQMSLPYPQSKSFQPRSGGSNNSRLMTPAAVSLDEPEAPVLSDVRIPELISAQPARTRSSSPPPLVDNDQLPVPNRTKSIRKKAGSTGSTTTEEAPTKRKRGVVNGTKLGAHLNNIGPNKKIRLEVGLDGINPANRTLRSFLVHAIGAYVKTVVPMDVSSFSRVPEAVWDDLMVHLRCSFEILESQKWLKTLIMKTAANIFRGWKCKCKTFYRENPDMVPEEFTNRQDQWEWLKNHFDEPAFKSMQMKRIRDNRANHRSGKLPFIYRAQEYMDKGHKTAYLAAFEDVYIGDPLGAPLVAKMRLKLADLLGGEIDYDCLVDPLPIEAQLEIIDDVMGHRKRKPTAGPKKIEAYMDLREELEQTKQERLREQEEAAQKEAQSQAMMRNLEERIRALEDQRTTNAGTPVNAPSEGASYVNPNFVSVG